MKQLRKKGFTLVEILTVMVIAIPILTILYVLLSQTLSMYDSVKEVADPIGSQTLMISDIEDLSRDCDYAEIAEGLLILYNDGVNVKIDPAAYGLDATMDIDYTNQIIKISIGGEEHCVRFVQKIASD